MPEVMLIKSFHWRFRVNEFTSNRVPQYAYKMPQTLISGHYHISLCQYLFDEITNNATANVIPQFHPTSEWPVTRVIPMD